MRFQKIEAILFGFLTVVLAMTGLVYASHRQMMDEVSSLLGRIEPRSLSQALPVDPVLAFLCACLLISVVALMVLVWQHSSEEQALRKRHADLSVETVDLRQEIHRDPLTGLKNRRYFDEMLSNYLCEFAKVDIPVGLMLLDLDRFKLINDRYGHDAGDTVLKTVAQALSTACKRGDIVARLGGEEFAVIVPNLRLAELGAYANELRGAIETLEIDVSGASIGVSTSIGVAVALATESPAMFYKRADINLYRAKLEGRNRIAA